jgi:hypothetical protein
MAAEQPIASNLEKDFAEWFDLNLRFSKKLPATDGPNELPVPELSEAIVLLTCPRVGNQSLS